MQGDHQLFSRMMPLSRITLLIQEQVYYEERIPNFQVHIHPKCNCPMVQIHMQTDRSNRLTIWISFTYWVHKDSALAVIFVLSKKYSWVLDPNDSIDGFQPIEIQMQTDTQILMWIIPMVSTIQTFPMKALRIKGMKAPKFICIAFHPIPYDWFIVRLDHFFYSFDSCRISISIPVFCKSCGTVW